MKPLAKNPFWTCLFIITSFLILPGAGYSFPDDDGDGVDNEQERIDGTDPDNPDSYIHKGGPEYCLEWNGFLSSLTQILELRNAGCSTLALEIKLRNLDGIVKSSFETTLEPSRQKDIIINNLSGFEANEYGQVCAHITSGDHSSLDAQTVTYSLTSNGFDFAIPSPYYPPLAGIQSLPYNHFFPTLSASQKDNFVAGFVQISNTEDTQEVGNLVFYSNEGVEIRRISTSIPAKGRVDLPTHDIGKNTFGLMQWEPVNSNAKFRVVLNRYFFWRLIPTNSFTRSCFNSRNFGLRTSQSKPIQYKIRFCYCRDQQHPQHSCRSYTLHT
jgi:hypothetical protein